MPEQDTLSDAELAAQYGWALSVLNSHPDLKNLFRRAVAENWDPASGKFEAELRNTGWFKQNSEQQRQALLLKQSDPATYGARREAMRAQVISLARQVGAQIPNGATLTAIADQALTLGWNTDQLRQSLQGYLQYADGKAFGQVAQYQDQLKAYARSMGVRIPDSTINHFVKMAVEGGGDVQGGMQYIQQQAASAFPPLAERIAAGETVESIAGAYRSTMADILEINPDSVDLFDPTIRSAISGRDKDGKPAMKSIWQFEQDLRKDPRWLKTKNAQDGVMAVARQVLGDFGVIA